MQQLSNLIDYTVSLKSENERLEEELKLKTERVEELEQRIGKNITKSIADGIERLEKTNKTLKAELLNSRLHVENLHQRVDELEKENKKLKSSLEHASQNSGEDLGLLLKVGDLTEKVESMKEMAENHEFVIAEFDVMKEADRANKRVQKEVEEEFELFRKKFEDETSIRINLQSENEELKIELENLKQTLEVKDIEIEQITVENSAVNSKKLKLFKDKVAEFEDQKSKILEESAFNAREVHRMSSQLKAAEDRIHILEKLLLKERHEKNKIVSEMESNELKPAEDEITGVKNAYNKDYHAYYDRALEAFDVKSRDQITKRKTSASILTQHNEKSPGAIRKQSESKRSVPLQDESITTKRKEAKEEKGRVTIANDLIPSTKRSQIKLPDLAQLAEHAKASSSSGSRLSKLERLTAANDAMEAWLSNANL